MAVAESVPATADAVVIGAGAAGAMVAMLLVRAGAGAVVLLDRHAAPARGTTGRCRALFTRTYGPKAVRRLAAASHQALAGGADGLLGESVLSGPRGALVLCPAGSEPLLEREAAQVRGAGETADLLSEVDVRRMVPVIRPGQCAAGLWLPGDLDLHPTALVRAAISRFLERGGVVVRASGVVALASRRGRWVVGTTAGTVTTPVVVNAAGVHAPAVAALAGLRPVPLSARQRTLVYTAPCLHGDEAAWPLVTTVDDSLYFMPDTDGSRLVMSISEDRSAHPDDDAADPTVTIEATDRFRRLCTLRVPEIETQTVGMMATTPDDLPVAGPASDAAGFHWLTGQGAFGLMMAPALADLVVTWICTGRPLPAPALGGVEPAALAPARFTPN